jgi:hypothetical protein
MKQENIFMYLFSLVWGTMALLPVLASFYHQWKDRKKSTKKPAR